MAVRNRVERLEHEARFQEWLRLQRYLEYVSDDQLEYFAVFGFWPDPPPPEPPPGACRLDSLPRKNLVRMWEDAKRKFAHRTDDEKDFYCIHAHWPEQACETSDCQKNGRMSYAGNISRCLPQRRGRMSPRSQDSGKTLAHLELEKRRLMRQLENVELRKVTILQQLADIELKKRKIIRKPGTP